MIVIYRVAIASVVGELLSMGIGHIYSSSGLIPAMLIDQKLHPEVCQEH